MGNGQQFSNAFNFDIAAFLYTLDHSCRGIHQKKRSKVKKNTFCLTDLQLMH